MVVASRRLRQITSSRSLPATPGETQRRRLQAKLSRTRQIVTQLQRKFTLPIPAQAKREDLIILIFKRSSKMNFLESQARISTSRIKGGQDRDFQVTTTLPPADEEQANKMSSRRHSTSSGSTKIQINVDLTKFGKTVGSLQGQSNDFKRSRQKDSIHRHGINQFHTRRRRNNELEEEAEPKIKKSVNLLRTRGSWTSKEVKLTFARTSSAETNEGVDANLHLHLSQPAVNRKPSLLAHNSKKMCTDSTITRCFKQQHRYEVPARINNHLQGKTTIHHSHLCSRIQGFVGQLKKARKKKSSTSPARSSVKIQQQQANDSRIQEPRCQRQAHLIGGSRQATSPENPKNFNNSTASQLIFWTANFGVTTSSHTSRLFRATAEATPHDEDSYKEQFGIAKKHKQKTKTSFQAAV
ncbi:hypothetical protein GCK72_013825 [Caenorhabditis remanei]|uniref:Uncharacterized protein n=1 Tax=Caenorhabditis remanei TaxID=31234 RepID=A0A6A5GSC5_CAERE|nr:hypothetical protein GCK72_013825 [Caenorhabditis remanei]KAF1757369.1 hypothetical protein GCK72_013825 [Caenorhabditis remanei]